MKVQVKSKVITNAAANSEEIFPLNIRVKFLVLGMVITLIFSSPFILLLLKTEIKQNINKWAIVKGHSALGQKESLKRIVSNPDQFIRLFQTTNASLLPKIAIDLKFKDYQKIIAKRNDALSIGALVKSKDDFVKAKIRHGGETKKVKLRLKGDWVDHLEGDKWSLRIHTKGKNEILSLRRFSIQNPKTRGFQGEILFHETLSPFNIITPRYFFVDVVINGESIGVMALEEHFSKELLEHNMRKEGVIVRFDESLVWDANDGGSRGFQGAFDNFQNAQIDAFRSSKISKSKHLTKEYDIAVGLLRGFVEGELAASDVFDVDQMGGYIAAGQFWGAWHALRWHNMRFYLNPLTMKLEPIAYDANLQGRKRIGQDVTKEPIITKMLEDVRLNNAFDDALAILNESVIDGSLIKRLKGIEETILPKLAHEYYFIQNFDYSELTKRANYGKTPTINNYPLLVHAGTYSKGGTSVLELSNPLPFEVNISEIFWKDKTGRVTAFRPLQQLQYPLTLTSTEIGGLPNKTQLIYENSAKSKLFVKANIVGEEGTQLLEVSKYASPLSALPMPKADLSMMQRLNSFIEINEGNKTIQIKPGKWQVNGNIIIPPSYSLKILPGTNLQFSEQSGIISYGSASFVGLEDRPIVLEGAASDGIGLWQGVVVFKAKGSSMWDFVKIKGTTGIKQSSWELTGGVTFLYSNVDIKNTSFEDNKAEDALNIVHADFALDNVHFYRTASDAFDGDFVRGVIKAGSFKDIGLAGGGDGVDVSGSDILVSDVEFNGVDDKAISVGERSKMKASNITITNVGVGAASKDGSELVLSNTSIQNASVAGLMAYVKKPEYGAANLTAHSLSISATKRDSIVQTGSQLTVNGEHAASQNIDIKNLYQTVMKPGLR